MWQQRPRGATHVLRLRHPRVHLGRGLHRRLAPGALGHGRRRSPAGVRQRHNVLRARLLLRPAVLEQRPPLGADVLRL